MKLRSFTVWFYMAISLAAAGQTKPEPAPPSSQAPQPQAAPNPESPQQPAQQPAPQSAEAPQSPSSDDKPPAQPQPGEPDYNKIIFQNALAGDQLASLKRFEGATAGDLLHDKQFHKLMRNVIPDCMFHYGHDMPLLEAMETVLDRSQQPVELRDGRYLIVSGGSGPYLQGRGMMWIDLQDGVALGAFFFHPTNGEPTPAVNVFSRQVKEEFLAMSELPPVFAQDLNHWYADYRIPAPATRYFIGGSNKKILLEHDEDYCLAGDRAAPRADCQQMNADAADLDMDAANYLEQTHHATNSTAWMITGEDQRAWLRVRVSTCGDLLPCRIRLTRARVRIIIHRPPVVHRAHN
jgi:hypothetical protein